MIKQPLEMIIMILFSTATFKAGETVGFYTQSGEVLTGEEFSERYKKKKKKPQYVYRMNNDCYNNFITIDITIIIHSINILWFLLLFFIPLTKNSSPVNTSPEYNIIKNPTCSPALKVAVENKPNPLTTVDSPTLTFSSDLPCQ